MKNFIFLWDQPIKKANSSSNKSISTAYRGKHSHKCEAMEWILQTPKNAFGVPKAQKVLPKMRFQLQYTDKGLCGYQCSLSLQINILLSTNLGVQFRPVRQIDILCEISHVECRCWPYSHRLSVTIVQILDINL